MTSLSRTVASAAFVLAAGVAAADPAVWPVFPPSASAPLTLVSSSSAFDRACSVYYSQGNDVEVDASSAVQFCSCLAGKYEQTGFGNDALEFFARTYSDDLTTFIHEYPNGEAWMEGSFRADAACKAEEGRANQPASGGDYPRAAGSWGGIVRDGPGREYRRLGVLEEGEPVTLVENTGVMENGYPWFRILYRGQREGYKWGGILCSADGAVSELYETCR